MLRALVWKEWREQRALLATGVALAVMLPLLLFVAAAMALPTVSGQRVVDMTMLAFIFMLWPIFVAGAGAGTFASEAAGRTAGFLLSRPVSRRTVWLAKVGLAAGTALGVVASSLAVARLLQWSVGIPGISDPAVRVLQGQMEFSDSLMLGVPALYFCFCAAAFLSARVARPLAAALGGLVTMVAAFAALALLSGGVGVVAAVQPLWAAAELTLAGTLLLTLSLRRFARGEALADGSVRYTLGTVALVLLITSTAGFVPAFYVDAFGDLDRAVTHEFALSPDGSAAVVTAAPYPLAFGSLWRLPDRVTSDAGDGHAAMPQRLSRRVAFSPFFSNDGRWVYYFTAHRLLGRVTGNVDLWRVRIDGTEEQLVVESVAEIAVTRVGWPYAVRSPSLSPDGARVTFAAGWWGAEPLLLDLERGTAERLTGLFDDVDPSSAYEGVTPIAWTRDGQLLLRVRRNGEDEATEVHTIVAHDVESGVSTNLASHSASGEAWGVPHGLRVGSLLPLHVLVDRRVQGDTVTEAHYELAVVELPGGGVQRVESLPCGYPDFAMSATGTVVAYRRFTSCSRRDDGELVGVDSVLVVRNLVDGSVHESAWSGDLLDVWSKSIGVSPGGGRASLYVRQQDAGTADFRIVEADGVTRSLEVRRFVNGVPLDPLWEPHWLDESRILIHYRSDYSGRYLDFNIAVIMNVNDGSVDHEFIVPPTGESAY